MPTRLVLLAAALLTTVATALPAGASAAARPPRPAVLRVADFPVTDGHALAAWLDHSAQGPLADVRVLRDDQPLGAETIVPAPPGCGLVAAVAAQLGYQCHLDDHHDVISLQDPATGAVRPTAAVVDQSGANSELYSLIGLGTALARFRVIGIHVDGVETLPLDAAAKPGKGKGPSKTRIPSLDARSGAVALCAPLRIGTHRAEGVDDLFGPYHYTALDDAAYRPPWLLTVRHGRALLRHCGSRRVRDLGPAQDTPDDAEGSRLVATSRYVAWRSAAGFRVHRLADDATWSYGLPLAFTDEQPPEMHATDRRLWIGDPRGNTFLIEP